MWGIQSSITMTSFGDLCRLSECPCPEKAGGPAGEDDEDACCCASAIDLDRPDKVLPLLETLAKGAGGATELSLSASGAS